MNITHMTAKENEGEDGREIEDFQAAIKGGMAWTPYTFGPDDLR